MLKMHDFSLWFIMWFEDLMQKASNRLMQRTQMQKVHNDRYYQYAWIYLQLWGWCKKQMMVVHKMYDITESPSILSSVHTKMGDCAKVHKITFRMMQWFHSGRTPNHDGGDNDVDTWLVKQIEKANDGGAQHECWFYLWNWYNKLQSKSERLSQKSSWWSWW